MALVAVLAASGTIEAQQIVRANVSVTARVVQGTFPVNAAKVGLKELPAGKYRFTVGGQPGALGTLTYDLVRL